MRRTVGGLTTWFVALLAVAWSGGGTLAATTERDGTLLGIQAIGRSADVDVFAIRYASERLVVRGRLYWPARAGRPPSLPAAPRGADRVGPRMPAVLFNHDGISGIGRATSRRAAELAAEGFVVLAPSYRGEDGSEGTVEVAAGEVRDVLSAARLLMTFKAVDGQRLGCVGMSHGALIGVLAAERSRMFRAVVAAYGVMDIVAWWEWLQRKHMPTDDPLSRRIYGRGPQDRPQAFRARSAVVGAASLHAPLLLLQGQDDAIVPPEQAQRMAHVLTLLRKPHRLRVYPGARHGFLVHGGTTPDDPPAETRAQREAWGEMLTFLRAHLVPMHPGARHGLLENGGTAADEARAPYEAQRAMSPFRCAHLGAQSSGPMRISDHARRKEPPP